VLCASNENKKGILLSRQKFEFLPRRVLKRLKGFNHFSKYLF
jgi:hypothetical protein